MHIFKTAYCTQLALNVRTGNSLEEYDKADFSVDPDNCIQGALEVDGATPILNIEDDVEAAISIYKYLGELDELEASDRRLWTTLTHVTFREYVMARWPARFEKTDTRKNSILKRWFAEGGSDRTLEQNAIARLWWGAHLTVAPWKSNPDEFKHLEQEDEFYYTKLLFSLQELIKVTMESSLGRSNKFLVTLLAYLDKHQELVNNKDIGPLMKELNLIAGANKVLVLNAKELEDLIEDAADSLFAARTSTYAK
jgi:hypothetical protein